MHTISKPNFYSLLLFFIFLCSIESALANNPIRIGILKFGTVSWELDVIKHRQLDKAEEINIEVIPYASKQATLVALQGGSVDMIVTDWIWVSKQRSEGKPFTFIPYSSALGAIMVPGESTLRSLPDLRGKKLGVAGGALDKSWLMLRIYAKQKHSLDLLSHATPQYAAPPLLNGQIENNQLDAVLNYWHYCTRLESKGYRRLIPMQNIVSELLGFSVQLPMLGYVFNEQWADKNQDKVIAFATATQKAREIMLNQDAEWDRIRPKMKVTDDNTFTMLRKRYREGIPRKWAKMERAGASIMMHILAQTGGEKLVGENAGISAGTFWNQLEY